MRRYSMMLVVALSILLFVSTLAAQQTTTTGSTTTVPNLIRYSGTLKEILGTASAPATTVGMTFAIYKQQEGGAPIWQETQNVTPDAKGEYSVLLGTTTSTGLPDDLFSQQEQRWLGIQLQGEAELPRLQLVSVPYAFKAHEAETLGGLPASAFVKAPPSDGSGVTYIGAPGSASQTVSATGSPSNGTKSGAGIDTVVNCTIAKNNYIPVFTGVNPPNIIICNSVMYQASGTNNIGIGTITPVAPLDVNGAINTSAFYQIFGNTVLATPGPSGSENLSVGTGTSGTLSKAGSKARHLPPPFSGSNDTAVGIMACSSLTSGSWDTCIGDEAGHFTTTGIFNTNSGYNAGYNNTTGNYNSCYGSAACLQNLTGNQNVAVGVEAGWGNTTGSNNTMMGFKAGFDNTASNGSFYGYQAGFYNTADSNSFYGYQTGFNNNAGSQNAFFGNQAGYNNLTGAANTFSGSGAGYQHINGDQNTFVGTSAGFNDYYGKANTFIGASAGQSNGSGTLNTYVGVAAGILGLGSSNTFIGNSAGFFLATGDFNTFSGVNTGRASTFGSYNSYYGYLAGNTSGGSYNSYYGYGAGNGNSAGSSNVYLANSGANESNTIRIGTMGTNPGQQNMVFIDPIIPHPGGSMDDFVTINTTTGQLGHLPGGGGNFCAPLNYTIDSGCDVILSIDNSTANPSDGNLFVGVAAGNSNTTGVANTFLGHQACYNIATGNDDICIGDNVGPPPSGSATSNTIWIGAQGVQHATYIGGISGESVGATNAEVCIDTTGKLGTVGCPNNLSELQKQQEVVAAQQAVIKTQQEQIQTQGQQIADLQQRLSRLESLIEKE